MAFNGVMPAPQTANPWSGIYGALQPQGTPPPAQPAGPEQADINMSMANVPMGGAINLNKSKRTTVTDKPIYADPAEYAKRVQATADLPDFQQAKTDEGDLRSQIQGLIAKNQNMSKIDFSPLLALADAQTGGHQAQAYHAPQDLTPEITKGLASLAAGDTGTLGEIQKYIAGQKTGDSKTTTESDSETGTKGNGANQVQGNSLKWHAQLTGDKALNTANTAADAASTMKGMLDQNSSMSDLMAKIQALRASGLNRVTNFEVDQMGGDRSLTARANQALQTLQSGNFTEQNRQELQNAVNVLAQAAPTALKNKRDEYDILGATAGVPDDKRKGILDKAFYRMQAPTAPATYDGSGPLPANATPEQKQARTTYLIKKAGG